MTFKKVKKTEDVAFNIKFFVQMVIGVCVFTILCKHFLCEFWEIFTQDKSNQIDLKYSLQVVSYGLGISAGIEMAYMLFTPGPDEAVEPIILGLASTFLYVLSSLDLEKSNLIHFSIILFTIGILIGGLFFIKDKYVSTE
ncbi:MAG: hypothetical protein ACPGUD_12470 [Parashewanella sp.]